MSETVASRLSYAASSSFVSSKLASIARLATSLKSSACSAVGGYLLACPSYSPAITFSEKQREAVQASPMCT